MSKTERGEERGKTGLCWKANLVKNGIPLNGLKAGGSVNKDFKQAVLTVNKIIKKMGRADIDYTIQISTSSIHPNKLAYCCQIEAPANGLAPLTWVKNSWKELLDALKEAEKDLDQEAVEKAYYASEIKRAEEKKKFFEEKLMELDKES